MTKYDLCKTCARKTAEWTQRHKDVNNCTGHDLKDGSFDAENRPGFCSAYLNKYVWAKQIEEKRAEQEYEARKRAATDKYNAMIEAKRSINTFGCAVKKVKGKKA